MERLFTLAMLRKENREFTDTPGISRGNRSNGFAPAFCNTETGSVELSRFSNGMPAPVHVFDGLPESWIAERDADAGVTALRPAVVAGFVRDGRFYTRLQAAQTVAAETERSDGLYLEPACS